MALDIKDILDRYRVCDDGWQEIYKQALDDLRFVYDVDGGQWPDSIKQDRGDRPMLTINKLIKFVRQLRGDARQNRPRVKVIPVDDKADVQMAELYDGLIRQIEYLSSAEVAYDTGYMNAVSSSVGYWRLITKYESEYSFNQGIGIQRITNPLSVRYDPAANEFDYSDAMDCFIETWMKKDDYKKKYGKSASTQDFKESGAGQSQAGWFEDDKIRLAEYFYKEIKKIRIGLIQIPVEGGEFVQNVIDLGNEEAVAYMNKRKGKVLRERDSELASVKWCLVNGSEIVEKEDWPGKYIPVIPVFGDEVIVNGKKYLLSLIRGAKDPQRMYNYWSSAATETVALAPKSPFIVAHKQIEGFENEWNEANRKNRMFLRFKNVPGIQKPSREPQTQVPVAIVNMMQNTAFELEDNLGRYESSKGQSSNERSGRAILARVAQSDKGTFTFVDNFSRAIIYTGRQLIDLIPKVYDTQRALQIRGEDGEQKPVTVNQSTGRIANGKPEVINDLTVGKYDLIATVGASYSSKRQEMVDMMLESMQYAPQLAPVIAPLVFKYSDWPGAQEISAELKKFMESLPQETAQGG